MRDRRILSCRLGSLRSRWRHLQIGVYHRGHRGHHGLCCSPSAAGSATIATIVTFPWLLVLLPHPLCHCRVYLCALVPIRCDKVGLVRDLAICPGARGCRVLCIVPIVTWASERRLLLLDCQRRQHIFGVLLSHALLSMSLQVGFQ